MDCAPRCRSKRHALQLITAVTRGTKQQIQLYLLRCHNPSTVTDTFGRTVLHVIASKGRWQVLQWLLEEYKTDLNIKDIESGWTALHRAVFYGQIHCAKMLIEHGANVHSHDKEGLTPLDLSMKDRLPHVEFLHTGMTDVSTWGENSNLTLGHEKMQARRQPEVVDYFRKNHIGIKQVVMSKYHTVFLGQDGKVYTCGHGRGGRLGHGNETTLLTPLLVNAIKEEECVHISAARDHTIFTMANGILYSCGLNQSYQLGQYPAPDNSLVPKQINHKIFKGKTIEGVCAQRFHTVVYTKDTVLTFGLNAGQLGHQKVAGMEYVMQPRQVAALNHKDIRIKLLASSDAGVVVVTSKGDVYALHEYQCRKVVSKWLDVVQVGVSGGCLDHSSDLDTLREKGSNDLSIVLLNSAGKAFLWRSCDPVLRRCIWGIRRPLSLICVSISSQVMAFVTADGEAFIANMPCGRRSNSTSNEASPAPLDAFTLTLSDLVDKEEVEDIRITRLPLVHRATNIIVDRKGTNFAVLQSLPNTSLTDVPSICRSEISIHFGNLINEASTSDNFHDLILEVGNERMAVHRYILAACSEHFQEVLVTLAESHDSEFDLTAEVPIITINNADPGIVRQMLTYMYTDTCTLLTIGDTYGPANASGKLSSVKKSADHNSNKKDKSRNKKSTGNGKSTTTERGSAKNPMKLLHELAKRYAVCGLLNRLESVKYINDHVVAAGNRELASPKPYLERRKLGQLCDVSICGNDGHEIRCHKCVLVARLEYFHSMLSSGWIETSTAQALKLHVPTDVLLIIIDFLYTDEAPKVTVCENVEYLCNVLVVADQLLINRLKDMVQVAIVNLLNLRNVCEVLEFACVYDATQLKATCNQLICLNLAILLETRALDVLSPDVLDELTKYYRNMVGNMSRRLITPYDDWPSANYLEALEQTELGGNLALPNLSPQEQGEHVMKKSRQRRKRIRTKSSGDNLDGKTPTTNGNNDDMLPVQTQQALQLVERVLTPTEVHRSGDGESPASKTDAKKDTTSVSKSDLNASSNCDLEVSLSLNSIMSEQNSVATISKAKTPTSIRKISKISQKERKRMAAVHSQTPEKEIATDGVQKASQPWSWGSMENTVTSFKDVMMDAEKHMVNKIVSTSLPSGILSSPSKPLSDMDELVSGTKRLNFGTVYTTMNSAKKPTSPQTISSNDTNPWEKKKERPAAQRSISFSEIIKDEIEQKATLTKLTNKPLHLIQIEEQAIQELLTLYHSGESFDEYVTVTREYSHAQLATPTWAATQ